MTIAFLLRDWQSVGGIQRFAAQFMDAAKESGHSIIPMTPLRGFLLSWQADAIVIGHVNLLPLTLLIPKGCHTLLIYGIEAWKPLTFWQRLGLRRVHRVIGISHYTVAQARPYLGDKLYEVLPCSASVS